MCPQNSRGEDTDPDKRARFNAESEYMQERWAKVCEHDPFYNPNLTLDFEQPSPADPPRALRPWNDYIEMEDD
ncbi:hypothetical protein [Nisaea sp.]|uniref:hypothetical protein n=1 Tax=Nisaea sp. TaxID=2024842 RepID=UPI002B265A28|nr:hypothetical protein [Nisaea sp.]